MAQTLPNGVVIPEQTERISSAGVQEMRTLGVSVDTQLGGVTWQQGRKSGQNDAFTLPPGVHTIGSATAAENTANLPEVRPGTLIVESNAGEPVKVIRFHPHMTTHFWVVTSRNVSGAMTDWWKVDAARGHGGAYAPHTTRQAMMMHAIGGPINTGGRGAVAIRIDHGFANFKTKVLPILRTAGIVPMITYNPRNWDRAENDGVTPAEVNQWVADGWVEISNHGAHHTAAETPEALEDVIAGGLAEIEEQLPAAAGQVWGFCVPGVQSGNWMGFMPGGTPENWDTLAGSLIMKHHAFGSGYLPGTSLRVLDGTIRDGLGHATMDSATVASLRTRIDQAIAGRLGLQLMLHPSQLDEAGMMTTAQLQQVVDYIVAKRDAGELAVLSPYQMMVADASLAQGAGDNGFEARLALLEYDSGERNVTSRVSDVVSGRVLVWRLGRTVFLTFDALVVTAPETPHWHTMTGLLPAGFRPPGINRFFQFAQQAANRTPGPARVSSSGTVVIYNAKSGAGDSLVMEGTISFPAEAALPTSLPGTPA